MKIGVLTYYRVLNYGAVLQAYALQKMLKSIGHDVYLINYQPIELTKPYNSIALKQLRRFSYVSKIYRRKFLYSPFKKFIEQYLDEGIEYVSAEQLFNNPPKADAYIVGSDQVWRTSLSGDNDIFFLPFHSKETKKIAYAASCGGDYTFMKDDKKIQLLKEFDAISVREESLYKELYKEGIPSQIVVDPTILWDDYSEFIHQNKEGDYIVTYNVHYNSNFRKKLKILKEQLGLPVINIGPNHLLEANENLKGVSPSQWVNLLYHAKYVYTNSFHGVVFSVNFKKKFFYIPNNVASDSRVVEFLSQIGLQDTIINNEEDIRRFINTNYTPIANDSLGVMKSKSKDYLYKLLNEDRYVE